MKKKVLFVGSFLDKAKDGSVGGQMYACKSLLKSKLSDDIEWILLDSTGKSVPPPRMYVRLFLAIFRVFKFIYLLLRHSPTSVLIFSANGPSIYEKGFMIIIAKSLKCKTIFAPRGGPLIDELQANNIKRSFFRIVSSNSDYIICQGVFWKVYFGELLGYGYNQKLEVLPNWIDYHLYQRLDSCKSTSDAELNILFMGWMQVEKGVHDLFDALMRIDSRDKKINAYFLGDGNQRMYLKNRANEENKNKNLIFYFPGWIHGAEKLVFLHSADIFVLPSYAEGMPNSLMEAMASGIACISTNVGAVPDLIENGINGFTYKPKDTNKLVKLINSLINDSELRSQFARNARDKIYNFHSLERAVESFKRIL